MSGLAPARGPVPGALALAPGAATGAAVDRKQQVLLVLGLLLLDAAALAAAFALAYVLRFETDLIPIEAPPHSLDFYSEVVFWAVPVWLGVFAVYRLYDRRTLFAGFSEYGRAMNACTLGALALVVFSFLRVSPAISRGWLLATWVFSILLVYAARFSVRRVVRALRRRGWLTSPTLIVGANAEGIALAETLLADPGSGTRIVGFVDSVLPPGTRVVGGLEVLGAPAQIEALVRGLGVCEIIAATTALTRDQLLDLYWRHGQDDSVELHLSSGLFEILTTSVCVREISRVPLVTPQRVRITGADAVLKTALDYVVAAVALLVLAPLLLLIAVLIRLDSPGPALHRRRVLGVSGRAFDAYKFRTMVVNANEVLAQSPTLRAAFEHGYKLKVDPRITRVGHVLRRTSLDELPQLINVLRGEMSLVGPRMIAPEEARRYGKWQRNLLTVKPGITGPWQVAGRGDLSYDQRVALSMQYIRDYTFWLDLAIILRTVRIVLKGQGAY
jgi:exopolysaccharide biosynthesis polyprenyl glycosylphosphotransferase